MALCIIQMSSRFDSIQFVQIVISRILERGKVDGRVAGTNLKGSIGTYICLLDVHVEEKNKADHEFEKDDKQPNISK